MSFPGCCTYVNIDKKQGFIFIYFLSFYYSIHKWYINDYVLKISVKYNILNFIKL